MSNSCAPPPPPCAPPPDVTRWDGSGASCPSGLNGWGESWQQEEVGRYYCPAPTGDPAFSGWNPTGATRNYQDGCVTPPGDAAWENPGEYQWTVPRASGASRCSSSPAVVVRAMESGRGRPSVCRQPVARVARFMSARVTFLRDPEQAAAEEPSKAADAAAMAAPPSFMKLQTVEASRRRVCENCLAK